MSSASTATPQGINFFLALVFLVLISCSGGDSSFQSLTLILKTADGLEAGDPVILNGTRVGRIVRISPVVGEVEALARFENDFVPSRTARFELAIAGGGGRSIRIVDERPSRTPISAGAKVVVKMPPEVEEDLLWISH